MEKDDIIEIGEYYKEKIKEIPSKLIDFGKNLYGKFINFFVNTETDERIKQHNLIMERQNNELKNEIEKEKKNYEKEKQKIENEKKISLKLIKENKINKIKETNKKYEELFSNFEKIKNDKQKIIEFFNNLKSI
jgi:hypothetical protein